MSVGPLGMIGSAAGSPLAQGQGTDVNQTQQESANQARQTGLNEKAERAAGVGQTEQDEGSSDRDADGRRPWELAGDAPADDQQPEDESNGQGPDPRSKDPTGERGNQLDLSG